MARIQRTLRRIVPVATLALFAAAGSSAFGAISFTGTAYTQDFNTFAGAAGNVAFANDTTLPGLYAYISGGSTAGDSVAGVPDIFARNSATTTTTVATATYPAGNTVANYFYRPSASSTDVSLGFFNVDTNSRSTVTGYIAAGFGLTNNTGVAGDGFTLNYTVAASATALTTTDVTDVSYSFDATGVADTDATWTTVAGMGYSTSAAGVLTGPTVFSVTGLNWAPGSTLFIRFRDKNVGGTDRFSRIDNVVIAPEPTSIAIAGVATGALIRRRRAR